MKTVANKVLSILKRLDYPLLVVNGDGTILAASENAVRLVPALDNLGEAKRFQELLSDPPPSFPAWLQEATGNVSVRLVQKGGNPAMTVMVNSLPVAEGPPMADWWILQLHATESFSRQKYEREILLRIASVPIPEMTSEGHLLTPDRPNGNPISRELLGMIAKYLGGDAALLVRLDSYQQPSVIGQCGLAPAVLGEVLERFYGSAPMESPAGGFIRSAAREGFAYTLDGEEALDGPLAPMVRALAFAPCEIWMDGIAGFGFTLTFFQRPPDHAARQFATDAFVRLGRHLEATTYSNNMYEAFLELQKTQEQMIQSSKMAAIGELATGMAHELRQPVTAINNFLTTIFDHLEGGRTAKIRERLDEYRSRSRRNIERLSRIIDHLRTFGRQDKLAIRPTEVRPFIDEIFGAFLDTQLARQNIAVRRDIPEELPLVDMDPPRMEQVVLNLISNARDAVENVPNPRIEVKAEAMEGKLRLTVSDNGPGIPPELFDKVLNPFFTTKVVGKGTGVGLSISHGIVQGHQGELHIANKPDGGASFTVVLPLEQPKTGRGAATVAPLGGDSVPGAPDAPHSRAE